MPTYSYLSNMPGVVDVVNGVTFIVGVTQDFATDQPGLNSYVPARLIRHVDGVLSTDNATFRDAGEIAASDVNKAEAAGSATQAFATAALSVTGAATVSAGLGCNGKVAQASVVAGAVAPAGGTGLAAGAWDTAANRDTAIAMINQMRTALIANGIMS